jgi:hypothetical protein
MAMANAISANGTYFLTSGWLKKLLMGESGLATASAPPELVVVTALLPVAIKAVFFEASAVAKPG